MVVRAVTPGVPIPTPDSPTRRNANAAPVSRFAEIVAQTRAGPGVPAPAPIAPAHPAAIAPQPGDAFTAAGRQLLTRVARGERYVEGIVRQAAGGRAFAPADLLAMQAQVYRYTQELELVSKLVDRGTSTVKTILQQNG